MTKRWVDTLVYCIAVVPLGFAIGVIVAECQKRSDGPQTTSTPPPIVAKNPGTLAPAVLGGNSTLPADRILWSDGYVVGYDFHRKTPAWVCECLMKEGLTGDAKRSCGFHVDYRLPAEYRSSVVDYADRGYDLGHMAAAANHRRSQVAMDGTFLLSNVCPQEKSLNRGLWAKIEEKIRDYVKRPEVQAVWVVTGPLNIVEHCQGDTCGETKYIGPHQVMVPTHFFKALLIQYRKTSPQAKQYHGMAAVALTVRNEAAPQGATESELVQGRSTDGLEELVGLDLWKDLPDEQEARVEAAAYCDLLGLGN